MQFNNANGSYIILTRKDTDILIMELVGTDGKVLTTLRTRGAESDAAIKFLKSFDTSDVDGSLRE